LKYSISVTLSKSPTSIHALLGIVEDDASGISVSRSQATDTMPKMDAIGSPLTLHRAVMDGEGHRVALAQGNDFRPWLHAGALLGEYKLSAGEIGGRIGQKNGDLYGEDMLPIEILMEAVLVPFSVLEE
jgi:hypothetical protein